VAGDSPKSRAAISNLKRLCEAHLAGKYEIEVIDLKTRPELAKAHQILALPTLIRKVPEPVRRVIGDLSNADRTLVGLDIADA
jgi:circadian clock protein KaiB